MGPVGALVKAAVSLPVLFAHVRRELLLPTQLGAAWALYKGDLKKPVRVALIGLSYENATKAAYIINDLTGKKKAIKMHVLVRLSRFQERFGPFSLLHCT